MSNRISNKSAPIESTSQKAMKLAAFKQGKITLNQVQDSSAKAGEYRTREARLKQMGYMKASHFLIGSEKPTTTLQDMQEKEAIAQKWNPTHPNANSSRQNRGNNW